MMRIAYVPVVPGPVVQIYLGPVNPFNADKHWYLAPDDRVQVGTTFDGSTFQLPPLPATDPNWDHNASVLNQLAEVDTKKVRAITEYILNGNKDRLAALEDHASILRTQLRKGS